MGANTITNIMKVSIAGTSLNESEKKVYVSLCKKNNSQDNSHLKHFSMNPAMMGSQEQIMINSR